jgi:hypothetical protein
MDVITMNNSTRLFHWSKSFNLEAQNQDKNKTFNITTTPAEIKTKKGSITKISSVLKKVTVYFLELNQINFVIELFLSLNVISINSILCTSIRISPFTTAYARVHMNKIKLGIIAAGASIFYYDTDSIVTDLSLDKLKEVMLEKVGKELGQLKFECQKTFTFFISNTVYALLLNDGTIIKGKGFSTDSISLSEYENFYLYSQTIKANKIYGKTNDSVGSVFIDQKEVIID